MVDQIGKLGEMHRNSAALLRAMAQKALERAANAEKALKEGRTDMERSLQRAEAETAVMADNLRSVEEEAKRMREQQRKHEVTSKPNQAKPSQTKPNQT